MKHLIHFTNVLFRARGQIIIALLLFSGIAIAQETPQPPNEFVIGSTFSDTTKYQLAYYNSFDTSGMNSIFQYANDITKIRLSPYNVMATNGKPGDWIMYYATCYYSKWEAEQNQTERLRVGIKHLDSLGNILGDTATWKGQKCWSTRGLTAPACSLMYGPHYKQDNRYKSWQHGDRHDVKYYTRFNMALDKPESANTTLPVCKIKVVYRFLREHTQGPPEPKKDTLFLSRTLTVADFADSGEFDYFKFNPEWYQYPQNFWLPKDAGKLLFIPEDSVWYNDVNDDIGIQFWVEWLINPVENPGYTLYIDNVEVYDRDWKLGFMTDSLTTAQTVQDIQTYAVGFSDWPNLKYWSGHDEPYSIDAFTPIRIVDSLLYNNPLCLHKHHIIQEFNPYWTYNNKINGDTLLFQYYRMAKPEKLLVDMYPFSPNFPTPRFEDFDYLRYTFQECHTLQPSFWYVGQGFGESYWNGSQWVPWIWRYPEEEELKASVMLALAHGCKGLFFWNYDSYLYSGYGDPYIHFIKGLVDILANNQLNPTPLWYLIRDNLAPRLTGTLGKTLMQLDYTGYYVPIYYKIPTDDPLPQPLTHEYLTVGCGGLPAVDMYWHFGFFNRPNYAEDKYFFTTNLMQWMDSSSIVVCVTPPSQGYSNYRFRNVEGYFDTTFTTSLPYVLKLKKGEGYLYEVAPIVKYGGKLIYNETISGTTTLLDEMVIQNGATLTVNSTYNVDRDIRIKAGGRIITTNGGTLKFYAGSKLIIEGAATIAGTASHNLILDFLSPGDSNGIIINQGGSLTISYCEIRNANTGIFSELNANYLNAQNVDFINCRSVSIDILGR